MGFACRKKKKKEKENKRGWVVRSNEEIIYDEYQIRS